MIVCLGNDTKFIANSFAGSTHIYNECPYLYKFEHNGLHNGVDMPTVAYFHSKWKSTMVL